jgi:Reverse transcriptase (RNA-dependent DNA polymerase)
LPAFSKIYERAIYDRVYSFLSPNDILSNSQHGFRKKRSTTSAIFALLAPLYAALDRGVEALSLFYDLSKAFDTLPHELLLYKLLAYGIRGISHELIKSSLDQVWRQVRKPHF